MQLALKVSKPISVSLMSLEVFDVVDSHAKLIEGNRPVRILVEVAEAAVYFNRGQFWIDLIEEFGEFLWAYKLIVVAVIGFIDGFDIVVLCQQASSEFSKGLSHSHHCFLLSKRIS